MLFIFNLLISHSGSIYSPSVTDTITLTSYRSSSPSSLKFSIVVDDIVFTEGDSVSFSVDNVGVFFGFIFSFSRSSSNILNVVAYDQLRYFKNKDTYIYNEKTASQLLSMIAQDFNFSLSTIEDTSYILPYRIEENSTLFDIVQNALDFTLENTSQMFVLYDDFGSISLKNISSLIVNSVIDSSTAQDFSYSSSIDHNCYNKIKLVYENPTTGERQVFIAFDDDNISSWGVLQYSDLLKENENGVVKAVALMDLYDRKSRKLSVVNAFGNTSVRGGSLLPVSLDLGDISLNCFMLVEKVVHSFCDNSHFMNLTLSGGEFSE